MNYDYLNYYEYPDDGRLKDAQKRAQKKLRALIDDCIKIELDENYQLISVSTFRLKSKSSDPTTRHWRIVKEIPAYEDCNPCADLINENAVQTVLDNRRYFKSCHCCGYLAHIDSMTNQVCSSCQMNTPDKSEWLIEAFKKYDIRLVTYFEYHFSRYNFDREVKNLSYLDIPEFLRKQCENTSVTESTADTENENTAVLELDGDADSDFVDHPFVGIEFRYIDWYIHEQISDWKKIVEFADPIAANDTLSINRAMDKVINNRTYFHTCCECGQWNQRDHMSGRRCYSCMEASGIRF